MLRLFLLYINYVRYLHASLYKFMTHRHITVFKILLTIFYEGNSELKYNITWITVNYEQFVNQNVYFIMIYLNTHSYGLVA